MPIVNYVVEHMTFIEYATHEMLSTSERCLWYGLMDEMNHRAQGNIWPEEFIRIDNVMLCRKAGIKFDALNDARNKLKQRGLIDYIPGERNKKNPMYKMVYFYPQFVRSETEKDAIDTGESHRMPANWQLRGGLSMSGYPVKPDKNSGYPEKPDYGASKNGGYPVKPDYYHSNSPSNSHSNSPSNSPSNNPNIYNKLKSKPYTETEYYPEDEEEKVRKGATARAGEPEAEDDDPIPDRKERVRAFRESYFACFGKRGSPREITRILQFCHTSGIQDIMAIKAMEIAAGHGPGDPVQYTLSILVDWKEHHVLQPGQIDEYQVERDRRMNRNGLCGSGDIVEDWRAEQEAKERRRQENIAAGLEKA